MDKLLSSFDDITAVFIFLIISLFSAFLILEILDTVKYKINFIQDKKAIKFLNHLHQEISRRNVASSYVDITPNDEDSSLLHWLTHYMDIRVDNLRYNARLDKNGKFIFLCWPSRLNQPISQSRFHFAPTLLTSLGVLGTFIGVSIGLGGIDLQASNDFSALETSTTTLLDGLRTAFFTSVFGMLSALIFIFILSICLSERQKFRSHLRKRLMNVAVLETPSHFLARMNSDASHAAVVEMKRAATILSELNMPGAEQIGIQVANALKPGFVVISQELKAQRESIEAQRQELLSHLIHELRTEIVEPVVQRLDDSAAMNREASQAVHELKNELSGVSESLSSSIQTIQTFQTETLSDLKEFAGNLQAILQEFQIETKGVLLQVGEDVKDAVDQSVKGLAAQQAAIEISANKATQVMDTARDNLSDTLSNIDQNLQNTRVTVQDELEKFRNGYQENLSTFFEQQNSELSTLLNKQRQGLTEVVEDLRNVFCNDAKEMSNHIQLSMRTIQNTSEAVYKLSTALGLAEGQQFAQIKELANLTRHEVSHIENTYKGMAQELQAALSQSNEQLSQYLQRANQVYSDRLDAFDGDAAKVCLSLESTSAQFMTIAEYLASAAKDLVDTHKNYQQ